ncbi:MAG: chloride channel protein [Prevotella sp.]|nr:chloride channel protein [Prevotella sp.]
MITFIRRIVEWRESHVSDKQFVLLLAVFVGFFAAVAAFVLHWIIRQIQLLLTSGFVANDVNWLYLVYPVIGIYLTSLFIKHIVKDNISHGITRILYAISSKRSRLKAHNMWSSVIASAITIGFGGSVGAEAPIVLTGSAIGSNLGKAFKMDNRTLMLLVGCGAAAAIAGIFKAPIAGLVFTLEVLMIDLTMASLLPILVSAVTAVLFSYLFNGSNSLFQYTMSDGWMIERVPAYILLGVFGGLISLYFIRTMNFCEGVFSRLRHSYQRLLLGGIVLSMLIFLFPALYGEGYSSINILLNGKTEADWAQVMNNSIFAGDGRWLVLYIFFVLATKVFATSATNGGGGCGGTFAPSLFIGAVGGFFFARVWNMEQIGIYIPEKNFAMLGMAAVMAGVMHAPLTGVFLIAELTGGYAMFIPLMVVSIFAFLTINIFEPHSIYGMRLAREGKLITHHTDHAALTLMSLESIVDTEFTYVQPDMSLQRLVHAISRSKMPVLPVLDTVGRLLGEVHIDNIRNIMFRTELYNHFEVYQLMCQPQAKLGVNDSVEEVMHKFEQTKATMLPVEDSNGILVGYITHSRLYSQYRQMVADMSAE